MRKGLTYGVAITTIAWSMGIASIIPVAAVTIVDGDLVKTANSSALYLIAGATKRVFPHAAVYHSWGYPSNYSTVKTVPAVDLATYTDGTPIPFRDGSLFRGVTSSLHGKAAAAVFAVSKGQLRPIKSSAVYQALYNDPQWKLVKRIPDNMLSKFNYPIGSMVDSSSTHPDGTVVKYAASSTLYLISGGQKRTFASWSVYTANRYQNANVVTIPDAETYADGANITGAESALVTPGAGPTVPGVGLTVALAADTPVAGTIIAGQSTADLMHLVIKNGSTAIAKVTKVVLKRIGISGDEVLENVYLFDGAVRLTDSASVSAGSITFANAAGLFTIPASGTKNIAVKSDIKAGTSGQTVGVQLAAITDVEADVSVAGTCPISGNIMSIATATLAVADFTGATLPNAANIDPAADTLVWQRTLSISPRSVNLNRFALREIGSINFSDLKNFRLYVDGIQVGSAVANLDTNGYVTFAPSTPYVLASGSRVIKVLADVVGGSSRNFSFSLRAASDIGLVDSSYNVEIRPLVNNAAFTIITAGIQTINSGTVTVQKATASPSGNVILNGSDVVLATYTITAYGEPVKIETLKTGFTYISAGANAVATLRNGRLLANGAQVGSTATLVPAGTTYTTNLIVNPGTPATLEVRADIYDNDGTGVMVNGDTIVVKLMIGASNAQGQTSLTLINVPTADSVANTLTVASGAMTLSKYTAYTNQTVVVPQQTAYKLASFNLIGNTTEDINVNTIQVDFVSVAGTTFTSADLADVYVKYGTTNTSVKPNVNATGNTWSISYTLAKNASIPVEVYALIGSNVTSGDAIRADVLISGTTASSGQSVNTGAVQGQTMTAGVGSITSGLDASSPAARITVGNTTSDAAVFVFTTTNDNYTITGVVVKVGSAGAASTIQNVVLKDGGTILGTAPVSGTSATFSGLSVAVAANTSKKLVVALQLGAIGTGAGTSGANDQITLDSFKSRNSQGVEATNDTDQVAKVMYVYKSIPTITNVTLPSTTLTTGTITLGKISIAANAAGPIAWKKIIFSVNKTANPVIANVKVYDADTNTEIAGAATVTPALGATGAASGTIVFVANSEEQTSGTKTYVLKADVSGAIVVGDNINTNIAQPSTYAAPAAYATVAGTASFVWSDMSVNPHTEATSDWNNDYLVKNLPTDAQVLSK